MNTIIAVAIILFSVLLGFVSWLVCELYHIHKESGVVDQLWHGGEEEEL